nr:MAG TPA: hypothetical protein [Caudoviricetes sp.]
MLVAPTEPKEPTWKRSHPSGTSSQGIAGFEQDEEVVEVTYYIGVGDLVNSFYLSPDDTLDLIIKEV